MAGRGAPPRVRVGESFARSARARALLAGLLGDVFDDRVRRSLYPKVPRPPAAGIFNAEERQAAMKKVLRFLSEALASCFFITYPVAALARKQGRRLPGTGLIGSLAGVATLPWLPAQSVPA